MILKKIVLENFRQFYGKQSVDFSVGKKNITILFGENGKGKTGIFRALIFALYGDKYIEQDNENQEIHLVNFLALEENQNQPITSKVTVYFINNSTEYILEREIIGVNANGEIKEKIKDASLKRIDSTGNIDYNVETDKREIEKVINKILDSSIKDFFLFDAEKIDTLAKTDDESRAEVKNGIIKLLQIDKIEKSIEILRSLHKKEKRKLISKSKSLDLEEVQQKVDHLENEISAKEKIKELKLKELNSCKKEIERLEKLLSENKKIREMQNRLEFLQKDKKIELGLLSTKKEDIKRLLVNNGALMLMSDTYLSVKNYLNQLLVDQKDLIPYEVIEKSLKEKVCACCKLNLEENKENYENIEILKNNYKRTALTPFISQINNSYNDYKLNEEEQVDSIELKLKEIRKSKQEINRLELAIEEVRESISNEASHNEDFESLEINLKNTENNLQKLEEDISLIEESIEKMKSEKKDSEDKFDLLLRKKENLQIDAEVLLRIELLKDSFTKIYKTYNEDMRNKLANDTTTIFRKIIDEKDKDLVSRVEINDKYEIILWGWNNIDITQDISQGQRQMMALAFISALAKAAAGDKENITFPLFMDTPFGRISGDNRDLLIQNIPHLTNQWILLLTDTELTISEEVEFKETGKLGKWYYLDQIELKHSKIRKIGLNESIAKRG